MAGVHFEITATNSNFIAQMNGVKSVIEKTAKATRDMGNMFDREMTTAGDKVKALNRMIAVNEERIGRYNDRLSQWRKMVTQAATSGDKDAFERITTSITRETTELQSLIETTNSYRAALEVLQSEVNPQAAASMQPVEVSRLFKTQEDYDHAEQLRVKITELQAQIHNFNGSDDGLMNLTQELTQTREELTAVEQTAAEAAAQLGENLGGRAAEASSRLYELNTKIQQQQGVVDTLKVSVSEAAAELERVKEASGDMQEIDIAQANYDALAASLNNATGQLTNLMAAQRDAQTEWNSTAKEIDNVDSALVRMCGGQEKYNEIVSLLPGPLKSVINGIQGMTSASLKFIATPIGAVIMAVVLAFKTLQTYFTSSAEGQMEFAKASGYLSGVMGQLKEIVIAAGKAVYDYYRILGNALSTAKNFLTGDFDAMAASFDNLKQAAKDCAESTMAAGKQIYVSVMNANAAGEAQAAINARRKELETLEAKWGTETFRDEDGREYRSRTELKKAVAESQYKMYDQGLSAAERKKAADDYKDVLEEQYEAEKYFAAKRRQLAEEEAEWTTNPLEVEHELARLREEEAEKEIEYKQRLASLRRRENSLDTAGAAEDREAERRRKELEQQQQAETQLREKQTELELSNRKRVIDLMEEGHEKQMAMIEQEYREQMANADKLANDLRQLNLKAKVETGDDGLTDEQRNEMGQKRDLLEKEHAKRIEELYDSELSDYLTYEQARLRLAEEFQHKREALYTTDANGNRVLREGVTQGNIDRLNLAEKNANETLVDRFSQDRLNELRKSIDWETVFGDLDKVATMSLRSLRSKLQEFVKDQKNLSPDALKTIVDAIEQIDDKIMERDPFTTMAASFDTLRKATDAEKLAQTEYNRVLREGTEAEITAARATLEAAKNTRQKALAEASEAWGESVRKAQEIYGIATSITETLGSLGVDLPQQLSGFVEGIGSALDGLGSIDLTKPMSIISGGVKAIGGVIKGIGSLFNNDSKHERNITRLQGQVDALKKSFDVLGDAVEDAYSKDASELIDQQSEVLERQKLLIQSQIKEEEAKKHTDKDRIKEWKEQIEDIDKMIGEYEEKAKDAIFGETLQQAIENFSDAYANAWDNGTDRAVAAKDTVKNMMKQMVTESIKAAVQSSKSMEQIRAKLDEFYKDNVLSDWEQDYVLNMAESLQKELDQQFGWAEGLLSGNKNNAGSESAATVGYTTQLSEDTGTEISGRLTAMIDVLYTSTQLTVEGNAILNSILVQSVQTNEHLTDIKDAHTELRKTISAQFTKLNKTIKEQG